MKKLSLVFIFVSFLFSQERYSHVQIPVASAKEFQRIAELGLAVDHFDGKIGDKIFVFLSESELKELDKAGIGYSIQIKDWQKYYNEQQSQEIVHAQQFSDDTPKYFRYGSMGGFLIYDEVLQQLDSMKLLFPNLITTKDSVGTTIEGRKIYAVKISDNPTSNESSEPEVLYTALHHAREPQSMMTVIYYMWWLLENYNKYPEATYLVNNRQIWFIPVVNPDGYVYNATTNPNGGGMHRKNRRDVGTTNKGVDLNRNYGPFYMWNAPNGGSSDSTNRETYRGVNPFSEPETYAINEFMRAHNIKTCFNYHTYSNLLIYPWGYASKESPDSLLFREWAYDMTTVNRYAFGTDLQTVAYSTRGNSDDYMYGDTSKPRTYAMTPEVGITGFWPPQNLIYPLAQENLLQNKLLAHYAGHYTFIRHSWFEDTLGQKILSPRLKFNFKMNVVNKGLSAATNLKVVIEEKYNTFVFPQKTINYISSLSDTTISIQGIQNNNLQEPVSFIVTISDSNGFVFRDSIWSYRSSTNIIFSDDASDGTSKWNLGSGWNITSDAYSPPFAFTDSPNGKYAANSDNSLTMKNSVFLPPPYNELRFYTKWSIESTWDFATVEMSTDNGGTWKAIKTKLSRKGSGRNGSKQPATVFGYDGFSPAALVSPIMDSKKLWIEQSVNLIEFNDKEIKVRFRLAADNGEERDGWYLDDIHIIHHNFTPLNVNNVQSTPFTFSLSQNFPNPFNPATNIRFSIANTERVTLKIYDVLGREIATPLNDIRTAGNYSVSFTAAGLSSGIYFYRLTSGSFSSIKKMTVLK